MATDHAMQGHDGQKWREFWVPLAKVEVAKSDGHGLVEPLRRRFTSLPRGAVQACEEAGQEPRTALLEDVATDVVAANPLAAPPQLALDERPLAVGLLEVAPSASLLAERVGAHPEEPPLGERVEERAHRRERIAQMLEDLSADDRVAAADRRLLPVRVVDRDDLDRKVAPRVAPRREADLGRYVRDGDGVACEREGEPVVRGAASVVEDPGRPALDGGDALVHERQELGGLREPHGLQEVARDPARRRRLEMREEGRVVEGRQVRLVVRGRGLGGRARAEELARLGDAVLLQRAGRLEERASLKLLEEGPRGGRQLRMDRPRRW